MQRTNFDMDVLRAFTTGVDLGSFARAAERLGRSTSAVSAQLRKLEDQAGLPLFRKSGRGLALTEAGETMLSYARRLLELNDEAAGALHHIELEGWVRLGMQEDFGETILPAVLGRFRRANPKVRIEARIARNAELIDSVATGKIDLALAWETRPDLPNMQRLAELPMIWVGSADATNSLDVRTDEPLALAALEAPCVLRATATGALDKAGIPWRMAFTSPSLAGFWAAVAAGLGVGVRTPAGLPASVRPLSLENTSLPALPPLRLALYRAETEPDPLAARLAEMIDDAVRANLPDYAIVQAEAA